MRLKHLDLSTSVREQQFRTFSVHSFHRTKTIATGEGGALLTDDQGFYERCKFLRDHGRSSTKAYFIEEATTKYMPSNLIGSLSCAQLDRIDELISIKTKIRNQYDKFLRQTDLKYQINGDTDNLTNGCWATTIILEEGIEFKLLFNELQKQHVPLRPFFYPLSVMPAYSAYAPEYETYNSNYLSKFGMTLPSHYTTSNDDCEFVLIS